jgi:hypothetical protein
MPGVPRHGRGQRFKSSSAHRNSQLDGLLCGKVGCARHGTSSGWAAYKRRHPERAAFYASSSWRVMRTAPVSAEIRKGECSGPSEAAEVPGHHRRDGAAPVLRELDLGVPDRGSPRGPPDAVIDELALHSCTAHRSTAGSGRASDPPRQSIRSSAGWGGGVDLRASGRRPTLPLTDSL